jgi:hypothetical protein
MPCEGQRLSILYGPERANDYSPGCKPGVLTIIAPGVNPGSGGNIKSTPKEWQNNHGKIQNICGIERICAAPSELEGSGGGVPRVYTRGYILCLLQRHKNEG